MRRTRRWTMPASVSAAALFFGATIALRASVLAAFETTYPTDVAKGFARSVSLDPTATERAAGLRVEEKKGVASCGALAQSSTTRQFDHATAVPPQWLPVVVAVPRWNNVTALNPASLLSDSLLRNADTLRPRFTEAQPFPHIAIDGFMKHEVAEKLLLDFPPFESANNINEFGKPGLKAIQPDLRSWLGMLALVGLGLGIGMGLGLGLGIGMGLGWRVRVRVRVRVWSGVRGVSGQANPCPTLHKP